MESIKEKERIRYTIGDVAEMYKLSVDTLRFYEKNGVIGRISRDSGGRRSFNQHDVDWIGFVNCLKSTGMPLNTIKEYRELMMQGDDTALQRKELMEQHREYLTKQMDELQVAFERINYKIEYYDEILLEHKV